MSAKAKKITQMKTAKESGFCVYLGPTITGVIQSGTVYRGTKEQVLKNISPAVEKYPLIKTLVVSEKTISEDRIKVKTPGNILFVNYNKLMSGKN